MSTESSKPAVQSKTNWFGLVVACLPLLEFVRDEIKQYPLAVSGIGVIIILLRQYTTGGVTWKK